MTFRADPANVFGNHTVLTLHDPAGTFFEVNSNGLTANNLTDKTFAANGVVTNDSTGLLHTTPTLPNTLLANSSVTVNGTAGGDYVTVASNGAGVVVRSGVYEFVEGDPVLTTGFDLGSNRFTWRLTPPPHLPRAAIGRGSGAGPG